MLNTDNLVQLSGRLTRDAETVVNGRQVTFDIAIDNSGYESYGDNKAGFFTVKAWLDDSEYSTNASTKDMRALVDGDLLKKGVAVRVVGSLHHERWENKDSGAKQSKMVVMAERITAYVARNNAEGRGNTDTDTDAPAARTQAVGEPF